MAIPTNPYLQQYYQPQSLAELLGGMGQYGYDPSIMTIQDFGDKATPQYYQTQDYQDDAMERARTNLMEILGPGFGQQQQSQDPIGSLGLFGVPQGGTTQGGNFHNAMNQAVGGNTQPLGGLLSPGTSPQRPGRLTYKHEEY